ncbi:MAG: endonuclease/exonuclease/phosphatase family protein [Tannerellaceae bacterium]|nr:endonuclease/exonuclease/phosphatase family protein [Tannerellaceae bacterium]
MKKYILLFSYLLLISGEVWAQQGCELTVATFNLRMDTKADGEDAWPHRIGMVNGLVRFHGFDIFGTQEGFIHMLKDMAATGEYAFTGVGRDDGMEAGEHSAIFYRKDRFELMENGNFWLSETPETTSLGWDANIKRICSWGRFRDKECGKEFYFFNVHYDHEGSIARRESSKLLLARIKKIAGEALFFCTGDFNAAPEQEPMEIIYKDGNLKDSKWLSKEPPYGPEGTFHAFKTDAKLTSRIDYIFVSEGIEVEKYGVLTDIQYGRFPSDHFPVMAKVVLP